MTNDSAPSYVPAAAAHVSFSASWKMEADQGACVAGGRPLGLTMAATELQADAVVPDLATITVLGLECPPGDVTVGGRLRRGPSAIMPPHIPCVWRIPTGTANVSDE